jgi:hypothetical protein
MEWKDLETSTAQYFSDPHLVRGLTADEILTLSPDSEKLFLGPIDWSWGKSDKEVTELLDNVKSQYLVRCNQVEILLSEGGMLIERSLSDLMRYDELNVERFKVLIEFIEFRKTLAQQLAEQADDDFWFGLAVEQETSSRARLAAVANRKKVEGYFDAATYCYSQWNPGNEYTMKAGGQVNLASKEQYEASADANQLDSDSRGARKKFEERSRFHQILRRDIAQDIIALKIREFQRHLGAINYNERMLEIGKRALADFLEVYARVNAIALGLHEFYSDPSGDDLQEDLTSSRTPIEGAVTWLRKAANALARAKMDQEDTIVRLTIDRPVGTLLNELKKGLVLQFSDDVVPNMKGLQLRGLSATGQNDRDAWIDLEVTSPEQKLQTIDITLPAVTARLGRTSSASSLNVRDIAGTRPIINRSPIGDWKVRALRDHNGDSVTRVDLDFHLAFVRV